MFIDLHAQYGFLADLTTTARNELVPVCTAIAFDAPVVVTDVRRVRWVIPLELIDDPVNALAAPVKYWSENWVVRCGHAETVRHCFTSDVRDEIFSIFTAVEVILFAVSCN